MNNDEDPEIIHIMERDGKKNKISSSNLNSLQQVELQRRRSLKKNSGAISPLLKKEPKKLKPNSKTNSIFTGADSNPYPMSGETTQTSNQGTNLISFSNHASVEQREASKNLQIS